MSKQIEAIYENGVLRPLESLSLDEHQHALFLDALSVAAVLGVLAYVLRSRKRE